MINATINMHNRMFSIGQKDTIESALDKMIDKYQYSTGNTNPYLFMSQSTINAITEYSFDNLCQGCTKANGIVGHYCGYKVFRDDTLNFGEVEIR